MRVHSTGVISHFSLERTGRHVIPEVELRCCLQQVWLILASVKAVSFDLM